MQMSPHISSEFVGETTLSPLKCIAIFHTRYGISQPFNLRLASIKCKTKNKGRKYRTDEKLGIKAARNDVVDFHEKGMSMLANNTAQRITSMHL